MDPSVVSMMLRSSQPRGTPSGYFVDVGTSSLVEFVKVRLKPADSLEPGRREQDSMEKLRPIESLPQSG